MAADNTRPSACSTVDYGVKLPRYKDPDEPERYRLSKAGIEACKSKKPAFPPWLISFRFRTRYISALATQLDRDRPHLLDLQICPSRVARFFGACVNLLPTFAQSWIRAMMPEWFLPSRVILKAPKRDESGYIHTELFDNEARAYDRLKPLQGTIIPKCYGLARYNGLRALILERLGGVSLASPQGATLTLEEISALMQPCHRAMHAFGVHHGDPHPANYQLVDGKLMALDLEWVEWDLPDEKNIQFMRMNIHDLSDRYLGIQKFYHRAEGLLEPA
ncbi:uncharacterized protein P884DRAFT_209864 [Thermothelomyces heterothallicus CBS 202.75]|uniref:uncharacterized protein n=1 Tax=Thermothelomyces heterothallicus CBS 202.75 TaxID=1149848 RepID=UPI00374305C0